MEMERQEIIDLGLIRAEVSLSRYDIDLQRCLAELPPELQQLFGQFFADLARDVVDYHTSVSSDDRAKLRVSPSQIGFYKERIEEIKASRFFNPHAQTPRKITSE